METIPSRAGEKPAAAPAPQVRVRHVRRSEQETVPLEKCLAVPFEVSENTWGGRNAVEGESPGQ